MTASYSTIAIIQCDWIVQKVVQAISQNKLTFKVSGLGKDPPCDRTVVSFKSFLVVRHVVLWYELTQL